MKTLMLKDRIEYFSPESSNATEKLSIRTLRDEAKLAKKAKFEVWISSEIKIDDSFRIHRTMQILMQEWKSQSNFDLQLNFAINFLIEDNKPIVIGNCENQYRTKPNILGFFFEFALEKQLIQGFKKNINASNCPVYLRNHHLRPLWIKLGVKAKYAAEYFDSNQKLYFFWTFRRLWNLCQGQGMFFSNLPSRV